MADVRSQAVLPAIPSQTCEKGILAVFKKNYIFLALGLIRNVQKLYNGTKAEKVSALQVLEEWLKPAVRPHENEEKNENGKHEAPFGDNGSRCRGRVGRKCR